MNKYGPKKQRNLFQNTQLSAALEEKGMMGSTK